ncbi:fumarylacetoacetate hydrolase family protein [Acinetobacter modestus]|uniref:2-keto-4-pentenoate hydratase n=1 Tax=Acinetobacter modestus TaxID=1776740 RepID=UPI00202DC322|nr:fumarylacetoacetate hydrolase family protein [Acinetobacter modestus]MCM1959122.1 fumarylacetoacetate hydrolase family protein [Acinetobacter modestus]
MSEYNDITDLHTIADHLLKAKKESYAIAPVHTNIQSYGIEGAYKVQAIQNASLIHTGHRIVGRKIGLTALAVQRQLGVGQPDFGTLFDYMQIENEGQILMSKLIQPKIEAEIAFVLKNDLDKTDHSLEEVMQAIDYAIPAFEIVDSRIKDWKISILDTISDNASSAYFVLGNDKRKLSYTELSNLQMDLYEDDVLVCSGSGQDCLGNPINALKWLADQMTKLGTPLKSNDIVLSGAIGRMITVKAGSTYQAQFSEFSKISITFVED